MKAAGYACHEPNAPLREISYDLPAPARDQAIVKIAGCGLCHTDISFLSGEVKPRHALPLVLGHEISGAVVEAGEDFKKLLGKNVIVPAVMPCGACEICKAGYENTCKQQLMPGNDGNGGFATHILVPARYLAELPASLCGHELAELSVIADAVTTPYQSIARSGLKRGDVAVIIGAGGIGTYGVQIAAAFGANVLAIDVDDAKLKRVSRHGAKLTLNTKGMDANTAKKAARDAIKTAGWPAYGWKIFEMSGAAAGQELGFGLIPPSGTLAIVGFTMATLNLRLSNLMAFDATCFGNWGCAPKYYGPAIGLVLEGRVQLKPFIKRYPLSAINDVVAQARAHTLTERAILVPDMK